MYPSICLAIHSPTSPSFLLFFPTSTTHNRPPIYPPTHPPAHSSPCPLTYLPILYQSIPPSFHTSAISHTVTPIPTCPHLPTSTSPSIYPSTQFSIHPTLPEHLLRARHCGFCDDVWGGVIAPSSGFSAMAVSNVQCVHNFVCLIRFGASLRAGPGLYPPHSRAKVAAFSLY